MARILILARSENLRGNMLFILHMPLISFQTESVRIHDRSIFLTGGQGFSQAFCVLSEKKITRPSKKKNKIALTGKGRKNLHTILGFGGSVGLGARIRGGRGAVAEVVNDATKLAPGRLPTKHEAVPASRGRENLKPYEHSFNPVDTRSTSHYILPAGDG